MPERSDVALVLAPVPQDDIEKWRRDFPQVEFVAGTEPDASTMARVTILFASDPVTDDLIVRLPALRWLHTTSGGAGRFLIPSVVNSEILLTTSTGIHGPPFTEFALAAMFGLAKRLPEVMDAQRHSTWNKDIRVDSMRDRTVGIVGLGAIGSAVAKAVHALGFKVLASKRKVGDCPPYVDRVLQADQLDLMLAEADVLVISIPPWRHGEQRLIDAQGVRSMKRGSYLINLTGGVDALDENALVDALEDGHLAGVAINALVGHPLPPESRLWLAKNAIVSPGLAGDDPDKWAMQRPVFVENLQHFLQGEPLRNNIHKHAGD